MTAGVMQRYLINIVLPVLAGFVLDLLLGDPEWLYHPVRMVGRLISALEGVLRRLFPKTKRGERWGGICLVPLTAGATAGTAALLIWGAGRISFQVALLIRTLLCYWLFAVRSLREESMKVYRRLAAGDLPGARYAVSMIVGRDTDRLSESGVAKAAVETVAENTSDGVIAPMLYLVIGGPVLGWLYKAINTMDSMVGYKNERYLWFGRCAARTDDAANFLPARISALIMILSCLPARLDAGEAWRIFRRDRYRHASPNSAQTEAVMAGALHLQLAGDAWYFGTLCHKETIGDDLRPIEPEDIPRANRLLCFSACIALGIFLLLRSLFPLLLFTVTG